MWLPGDGWLRAGQAKITRGEGVGREEKVRGRRHCHVTTGAPPLVGTCDGRRLLSYEQAQGDGVGSWCFIQSLEARKILLCLLAAGCTCCLASLPGPP